MKFIVFLKEKISKTVILAIAILVLGFVITYYQNKLNNIEVPERVTAVVAKEELRKGEIITGAHLIEKKVFEPDKLKEGINDMSKLIGKVVLTDIVVGKEITKKEITTKEQWYQEEEREVGITFRHFTDVVGGKGKPFDIVDIMVSYDVKNTSDPPQMAKVLVLEKRILNVMNEDNITYEDSKDKKSFKPITALFRLTEEEELLIDLESKKGRLYLRRHGNYMSKEDAENEVVDKKVIIGRE